MFMPRSHANLLIGLILITFSSVALADECQVRVGEYSGRVKAEWLIHTREMRLLEDFAFKGPDCRVWAVPKGAIVDGASIPKIFWSLIGGPFDGPYRDGSVVHDYYCKIRTAPSDQVHEMFYHALLANGVSTNKAALMYYAVSWFGPQWDILKRISLNQDFGTFAVVRSMDDRDLTRDVIRQMAGSAGQPSPIDSTMFTGRFEARPPGTKDTSRWLYKDGNGLDTPREYASSDAFLKSLEKAVSKPYVQAGGTATFRLYSRGAAASPPTQEDVKRLETWIERESPSLAVLKSTPPNKVK